MLELTTLPSWLSADVVSPASSPAWLKDLRQRHWNAVRSHGLPTRKDERWKYTELTFLDEEKTLASREIDEKLAEVCIQQHRLQQEQSILLVLVNGYFMPSMSDVTQLPANAIVCGLNEALQQHEVLVKQHMTETDNTTHYPFANLNAALFSDGLFIYLPNDCRVTKPIHLLSIVTDANAFIAHPRHVFVLGKNSQLTLLEEYTASAVGSYVMNIVSTVYVGANSLFEHYKIQNESGRAAHLANTFIFQQQDSSVTSTHFSSGGQFSRDDVIVKLQETGAHCQTSGFYQLKQDNQYIDHHVIIDHVAPRSCSDMLYKGILDKKSRAVFNGRVHVGKDAQKIEAHQQNHNLLLSNQAEIYSKPELEIYSDDVKCKHGATTGQLDEDALFYLQSRGLERKEALNMLLQSFAADIVERVTHDEIKAHIKLMVQGLC